MAQYTIAPAGLPDEVACMLFDAWVYSIAAPRFELTQYGSGGRGSQTRKPSFGSPTGKHFVLHESGLDVTVDEAVDAPDDAIQAILDEAGAHVAAGDFGAGVVYHSEMTLATMNPLSGVMHLMRTLGDQVHIEGSRRLSDVVLLDFEEGLLANAPPQGLLFAPASKVQITIFAPGPCGSDLSSTFAIGVAEFVAAVCALATGRAVDYTPMIFPADEDATLRARTRRGDATILGLARDSISLDVFGELQAKGGIDAMLRLRGSLLAYHAALKQTSADVAVMLFVTSIEALISPRAAWGKEKVTQRFVKSLIELCPEAVDALLRHANVEEAFGYTRKGELPRQRRELLELIYETRSLPTHTGLSPSGPLMGMLGSTESMRVALLSDLARAAILTFLQAPRSSVIGHPGIYPPNDSPQDSS